MPPSIHLVPAAMGFCSTESRTNISSPRLSQPSDMVIVIFLNIFGVLCSGCGEELSVLNASVLRRTIHGFRHHEHTGERCKEVDMASKTTDWRDENGASRGR